MAGFTRTNLGGKPWLARPGAEGVPLVGLYSSFDPTVVRQHAIWFADAGVDCILVDWSNNLWSKTPWAARARDIQELINATTFALERYAALRAEGLIPTPKVVIMIGLANGPPAAPSALQDEAAWIASNYVDRFGAEHFLALDGKPALVVLDTAVAAAPTGLGWNVSDTFSVRWMGTQLQSHPDVGLEQGFWSWMDGAYAPVPAMRNGVAEALTVTPGYFTTHGGWLDPSAAAYDRGATFVATMQQAQKYAPRILLVCQWNEFAGQPGGPPGQYVDSYNASLTNDMEPISLTECGYVRPGDAGQMPVCNTGWGFFPYNLLAASVATYRGQPQSTVLRVLAPAEGAAVAAPSVLNVSWAAIGAGAGGAFDVLVDGARAARVPAGGPHAVAVDLGALKLAPGAHRVDVVAADGWHRFKLSKDRVDDPTAPPTRTATASATFNYEPAAAGDPVGEAVNNATAVFLGAPEYPEAMCLDGSPALYYIRKAKPGAKNATKWVLHIQGGGWCEEMQTCAARSFSRLGSSALKYQPPSVAETGTADLGAIDGCDDNRWCGALMVNNETMNPLAHDWNAVLLIYCDGASFLGARTEPARWNSSVDLHFRGWHNLNAIMSDLERHHGFGAASDVIIGGDSAGGLATYLHIDYMAERIHGMNAARGVKHASILGMPDSGYWPDDPAQRFTSIFRKMWKMQGNGTTGLPASCAATEKDNITRCLYPQYFARDIQTRLFPLQSIFDPLQKGLHPESHGLWLIAELQKNVFDAPRGGASKTAPNGGWLHSCERHCGAELLTIDGVHAPEAVETLLSDRPGGQTVWLQNETYPCAWCCNDQQPAAQSATGGAGAFGVDVAAPVNESEWKCLMDLKPNGDEGPVSFAIVRAFRSLGIIDANAAATIKAARAAGLTNVDAYLFPCVGTGKGDCPSPPAKQVELTMSNLKQHGADIGRLWLDIEPWNWDKTDLAGNRAFIEGLLDAGKKLGVPMGIYSSHYCFPEIVGSDWDLGSEGYPLWYAHYDGKPNFNDWNHTEKAFGGWKSPRIKQYGGIHPRCGVADLIDEDWEMQNE